MRLLLVLALISVAVGCGKDEKRHKTSTTSYSLNSLQTVGISIYSNNPQIPGRVAIICTNNQATISQKLSELTNFKNSLGIVPGASGQSFSLTGVTLTSTEANFLFNSAIQSLQFANPNSTFCPGQLLSSI